MTLFEIHKKKNRINWSQRAWILWKEALFLERHFRSFESLTSTELKIKRFPLDDTDEKLFVKNEIEADINNLWSAHLAAVGGDDSQVGRDPVTTFHLH